MDDLDARHDRAFELFATKAEAVLLIPPFADLDHPLLRVLLPQAVSAKARWRVRSLYTNLLFVAVSGEDLYNRIFRATQFVREPIPVFDQCRVLSKDSPCEN